MCSMKNLDFFEHSIIPVTILKKSDLLSYPLSML